MSESGSSSLKLRAEPSARSANAHKSEKGITGAGIDIENQGAVFEDPYKYEFMEASFFLALVSILVMNEGVIRMIHFGMPGSVGLLKVPLRFWAAFFGSLLEITNGILGLFVGIGGGVLDWYVRLRWKPPRLILIHFLCAGIRIVWLYSSSFLKYYSVSTYLLRLFWLFQFIELSGILRSSVCLEVLLLRSEYLDY